jgi:hypothetical protein
MNKVLKFAYSYYHNLPRKGNLIGGGRFLIFFLIFFILIAAWIFFLYPRTLHFRICDFSSLHIDGKTEINPKIWK